MSLYRASGLDPLHFYRHGVRHVEAGLHMKSIFKEKKGTKLFSMIMEFSLRFLTTIMWD